MYYAFELSVEFYKVYRKAHRAFIVHRGFYLVIFIPRAKRVYGQESNLTRTCAFKVFYKLPCVVTRTRNDVLHCAAERGLDCNLVIFITAYDIGYKPFNLA